MKTEYYTHAIHSHLACQRLHSVPQTHNLPPTQAVRIYRLERSAVLPNVSVVKQVPLRIPQPPLQSNLHLALDCEGNI